jgi:hypothetical protein
MVGCVETSFPPLCKFSYALRGKREEVLTNRFSASTLPGLRAVWPYTVLLDRVMLRGPSAPTRAWFLMRGHLDVRTTGGDVRRAREIASGRRRSR